MLKAHRGALFDAFAEDLLAERSARPLIIVGASKVEYLLLEILRAFLLPKIAKPKEQDELLEGDTPLATFSARIKVSRRLGLIDPTLYQALDRLRIVRNLSAHSILFDTIQSPLRERLVELRKLIATRESFRLTKERYFDEAPLSPIEDLQCQLLTLCVLLEALREKSTRIRENTRALSIAAK